MRRPFRFDDICYALGLFDAVAFVVFKETVVGEIAAKTFGIKPLDPFLVECVLIFLIIAPGLYAFCQMDVNSGTYKLNLVSYAIRILYVIAISGIIVYYGGEYYKL